MRHQRGSTIVEMAVMLPVLIVLLIGMVEFGLFIRAKNQMGIVANQVAGVLYTLRTTELGDDNLIRRVLDQSEEMSQPFQLEQMTVRFCEWKNGSDLWRDYLRTHDAKPASGIGGGNRKHNCQTAAVECAYNTTIDGGHGAFVQVTSCTTYNPIIITKILELFTSGITVQNTSYIPMTDTNQTMMLAAITAGGGAVKEAGCTGPDCGGVVISPDPDDTEEPEPEPQQCQLTCPAGQELTGSGPDCSCQIKNNCIGSVLDPVTNSCQTASTGCPDASYTYLASGDRCAYIPKQITKKEPCYFEPSKMCDVIDWEDCKPPSQLLASSGACIAFPNCPSGYTYDYTVNKCSMPNE